jgi:hypothetical protein
MYSLLTFSQHPLFNTSAVATIKITISEKNLKQMLRGPAKNLYYGDYQDAHMYFTNGVISKQTKIGFKLHGGTTRMLPKKGFNIKMSDSWKGIKTFALKVRSLSLFTHGLSR